MNIFIYDKSASVISAGLSYVIKSNFPESEIIRSSDLSTVSSIPDKVDLLILFQEQGQPVNVAEWQAAKERCNSPKCFGLLDKPTFKQLKSLLCVFPVTLLAYGSEVNDTLIKTVIENLDGDGLFYSKSITEMLHDYLCKCDDDEDQHIHLTRRENQVLELVRLGKSAPDIATELNLSVNTVQVFLSKLRKKYKVRNTLSLITKNL